MSESDEYRIKEHWRVWHLTPRGWIAGSYKEPDGDAEVDLPFPDDRVGTSRYSVIGSPMRGAKTSVAQLWLCEDTAKIEELVKKFGKTPQRFFE